MFRKVYIKEMKDAFRDRRTLFLTVFLPIIMMTVLTFLYEGMISVDEDKTYLLAVEESITSEEEQLISFLPNVELVKTDNPEHIVKEGDAHAGIIFSKGFIENISNENSGTVTIIGDRASQNSSILMGLMETVLGSYEKSVIKERLIEEGSDPSLLQPFSIRYKAVSESNIGTIMLAILIPIIIAISIGVGASPAAADLFAGEKERKTMDALLMTPVNRSTLLSAKFFTIVSIATIIGLVTLAVLAVEIYFFTDNLKSGLAFGDDFWLIMVLALIINLVYAMFCASILMMTSIVAKTVKEANSYASPIMMLTMFPAFFTTSVGVNELGLYHFVIPILNIFSSYKELLYGVVNFEHILITVLSNLAVVFVLFMISRVMFLKDKWVMN